MYKKFTVVPILLAICLILSACGKNPGNNPAQQPGKPVKIKKVAERDIAVTLEYIGTVMPKESKKVSFKSPGRIKEIPVQKGQAINKGDVIAVLDTQDLEYGMEASKAQMEAAQAQYNKALNGARPEDINAAQLNVKKAGDVYNFSKDNYEKVKKLYSDSAVSKQQLDSAKLDMDLRKSELEQAQELYSQLKAGPREEDRTALSKQLKQAESDYLYKKSLLEDAVLKADIDGFVANILCKEGEMSSAGYPVAVIRSKGVVVKAGVCLEDSSRIKPSAKVRINASGKEASGVVTRIDSVPDEKTRTYTVEIELPDTDLPIGEIVNIEFILGSEKGIMVPISSILSQGDDFVFIAEGNRAKKQKVEIVSVSGTNILVKGIRSEQKVVIEGMKRLSDGDKIIVKDSDN